MGAGDCGVRLVCVWREPSEELPVLGIVTAVVTAVTQDNRMATAVTQDNRMATAVTSIRACQAASFKIQESRNCALTSTAAE